MLRIHFTVEDLARLRMAATLGPVTESVFALDLFGRGGAVPGEWRKGVRERMNGEAAHVERLARERRPVEELLDVVTHTRSDSQAISAVLAFCQAAVLPYWGRVRGYLELERETFGRITITNGVECLLDTLHPKLMWNPPVLEVPHDTDRDVHLDGRGLLLSPSFFLQVKHCLFLDREQETGLPALVVSVPWTPGVLTELVAEPMTADEALGALVGHTRAAAMQALTNSCTTGVLSERLGISLAGASKHAAVLRKAGLITTARNRNTALHTLTSLGVALLRGDWPRLPAQLQNPASFQRS
ncbi:winged helix-turn-helix domain-containing protein [Streptosporangium sp. NPDC000239]|uniref:ArsR/SmtB family transcription factor n=1 Tax=Streptosporangium jomthongense TaxID=1193683 RepID=A0ABV8F767_9ACTN